MLCACYDDVLTDKDGEKQKILEELSTIYHSTIEPLESLYQYNVLGVGSFTGTYRNVLQNIMIYSLYKSMLLIMVRLSTNCKPLSLSLSLSV